MPTVERQFQNPPSSPHPSVSPSEAGVSLPIFREKTYQNPSFLHSRSFLLEKNPQKKPSKYPFRFYLKLPKTSKNVLPFFEISLVLQNNRKKTWHFSIPFYAENMLQTAFASFVISVSWLHSSSNLSCVRTLCYSLIFFVCLFCTCVAFSFVLLTLFSFSAIAYHIVVSSFTRCLHHFPGVTGLLRLDVRFAT